MGIKLGQFRTYDNDLITVIFSGESIVDGDLTLASSPVILQMDGGAREYTPVKYTTASVKCVCNGIELFDLYSQNPLAVTVEIRNSTQESVLFAGYVTPNNFSQPIDGVNDVVTIECVDWLGISKYMQYKKKKEVFSVMTLREAVLHTISLVTSKASVEMSQFVTLGVEKLDDDGYTSRYPEMVLSESFFFKNTVEPDVDENALSNERQALSCYEVLEMIASSIRGTWLQIGDCIYMCDILGIINNSSQKFYTLHADSAISDNVISRGSVQAVTADSFSSTGNTLSTLPRYSQFTLTREFSERSLMPSIFQKKYLEQNGWPHRETWYENEDQYIGNQREVVKLTSRLVSFTTDESNSPTTGAEEPDTGATSSAFFFGVRDGVSSSLLNDLWNDEWADYLRIYQSGVFSNNDVQPSADDYVQVNIDKKFILPTTGCDYYCIRIEMQAAKMIAESSADLEYYYPNKLIKERKDIEVLVRLKCGNKYYRQDLVNNEEVEGSWQDEEFWENLTLRGEGEWKRPYAKYFTHNILDGNIEVSLRFKTNILSSDKRPSVTIIKSFDVRLVQSKVDKEIRWRQNIKNSITEGTFDFNNNYGEDTTPISFGIPMTENNYSSYIEGTQYSVQTVRTSGGKMYFFYKEKRLTLLDRIVSLVTFGDGREFSLNLKDAHNNLSPLDAFTSPLWQGNKVMMGFEKDIERNEINVTLD